ncbi:MAG TPA: hypothetical protein VGM26_17710 [Rhizomicrobium sp.]
MEDILARGIRFTDSTHETSNAAALQQLYIAHSGNDLYTASAHATPP